MSPRIGHIIIITLLITPLITIHEPPSRVYGVCRVCKVCRAGRVCSIGFVGLILFAELVRFVEFCSQSFRSRSSH